MNITLKAIRIKVNKALENQRDLLNKLDVPEYPDREFIAFVKGRVDVLESIQKAVEGSYIELNILMGI